ncbi:acetyltransferase [Wenjunlia vitaminophila]|uniref:Acetyltransferase n=1 Tax=Wenjunlia vitaminophila TaxID=76728 RepID=A0A0T6LXZ0_WENVI|nr:GNAT family N-acetyltransferase [Wenjunlia vitaminophila]KRV50897.1 acetyltransferase [Wenjunlia vitaminophila]
MGLTFEMDPELTPELRDQVVSVWTDVSNADGAVGFVPPVAEDDVRPTAEKHFAAMAAGRTRLLAAWDGDKLVGTAFFSFNDHPLMTHWCWLYTVMLHPSRQGEGEGSRLLREAERQGRRMGLESFRLTCRGGTGLERFYASVGYREVGRVPAAIRVAPGDDRDDVMMWLDLR